MASAPTVFKRSKWLLSALLALVLVAMATGCGGSDSTSTSTLSKAAFQEKAKTLCEASREQYFAEAEKALIAAQGDGKSITQIEDTIIRTVLFPRLEKKIAELRALNPPSADEDQVEEILTAIEEVVQKGKADPERFREEQASFEHPFHHANELAKKYGLSACARA